MNTVILIGRLTRSPVLLYSKQGTAYTKINIAVNRYSKDKENQADFIFCTAFSKTAEFIVNYFTKGQEIAVYGNIKVDTYEKDGAKTTRQSVLIEKVEFVGSKKEKSFEEEIEDFTDNIKENENNCFNDEFPF